VLPGWNVVATSPDASSTRSAESSATAKSATPGVAAGEGKLDYALYLGLLEANKFHGPLLLHGLSRAQVPGCVAFLRGELGRVGG